VPQAQGFNEGEYWDHSVFGYDAVYIGINVPKSSGNLLSPSSRSPFYAGDKDNGKGLSTTWVRLLQPVTFPLTPSWSLHLSWLGTQGAACCLYLQCRKWIIFTELVFFSCNNRVNLNRNVVVLWTHVLSRGNDCGAPRHSSGIIYRAFWRLSNNEEAVEAVGSVISIRMTVQYQDVNSGE